MPQLKPRQLEFLKALFDPSKANGDIVEAARLAGYSKPRKFAEQLMALPVIRQITTRGYLVSRPGDALHVDESGRWWFDGIEALKTGQLAGVTRIGVRTTTRTVKKADGTRETAVFKTTKAII